jgi:hypothetical protein
VKTWLIVVAVVAAVALGGIATFAWRDGDPGPPRDGAAAGRTPSGSTTVAPSHSPGASVSSPGTPDDSAGQPPAAPRIVTARTSYFGEPFETIEITGRYLGVHSATTLRVQLEGSSGWTQFPLPTVTRPSGEFHAHVELGESGQYRLRIVDPESGRASRVLTLLLF